MAAEGREGGEGETGEGRKGEGMGYEGKGGEHPPNKILRLQHCSQPEMNK
jgi:hypothetical protein